MSSRERKERIDKLLVDRQIFAEEATAQRWIMSGKVTVNGQPVSKSGMRVDIDAEIAVRGLDQKYASRGGYKLEGALDAFDYSVEGKVVLDAGAAAGGFTSCLLVRGAKLIYAVDVGFGQMKGAVSGNPSVRNMERTNIGDLSADDLNPPIDLVVVDLSYLSLAKAFPILLRLFRKRSALICLIKPLFEGVSQEHKNSVKQLKGALDHVHEAGQANGLMIEKLIASRIAGSRGTIEFMGLFVPIGTSPESFDELRDEALREAIACYPGLIELDQELSDR